MLSRRAAGDPGRLRLRLILEKPARTPDGAGGATLGWTATGIVSADVTPGDRFRLGARIFLIFAVTDPQEDGRYLACLAEEEGRP